MIKDYGLMEMEANIKSHFLKAIKIINTHAVKATKALSFGEGWVRLNKALSFGEGWVRLNEALSFGEGWVRSK